ncbi:MAG: hypothetical protein U5N55_02920 [Cypionkella sp.]|nr:hypothetical protein [Cypionkella sp.]
MDADFGTILVWMRRSVEEPRAAARQILALNLPLSTASLALAAGDGAAVPSCAAAASWR